MACGPPVEGSLRPLEEICQVTVIFTILLGHNCFLHCIGICIDDSKAVMVVHSNCWYLNINQDIWHQTVLVVIIFIFYCPVQFFIFLKPVSLKNVFDEVGKSS